jgi:putative FmdB family regulatory protein
MPLFEYKCSECNHPFEELVLNASASGEVKCPSCGSKKIAKKISSFATKGSGVESLSFGGRNAANCITNT